jgi:hypothetical protein
MNAYTPPSLDREAKTITLTFFEGQIMAPGEFLGREAIKGLGRQHNVTPFEDGEGLLCVTLTLPVSPE